jgi:hypothetical protein
MVYTSELLAVSEKERSAIVIAISSLIHYEAWELLTEHHGLSPDEVATIWKAAIDRLLPVERP